MNHDNESQHLKATQFEFHYILGAALFCTIIGDEKMVSPWTGNSSAFK